MKWWPFWDSQSDPMSGLISLIHLLRVKLLQKLHLCVHVNTGWCPLFFHPIPEQLCHGWQERHQLEWIINCNNFTARYLPEMTKDSLTSTQQVRPPSVSRFVKIKDGSVCVSCTADWDGPGVDDGAVLGCMLLSLQGLSGIEGLGSIFDLVSSGLSFALFFFLTWSLGEFVSLLCISITTTFYKLIK